MEKWKEVFTDEIPSGNYETKLSNGEEDGLIIELKNNEHHIILSFGKVEAVRMLDEGIVQGYEYDENEILKYKEKNFKNIIYQIEDGEFGKQMQKIADGYWETLDAKHYVIITQNFNIDIITEWEPDRKIYM